MKNVSVREFQLHAKQYLKELPIVLTQYNLPVASVIPHTNLERGANTLLPVAPSENPGTPLPFSEHSYTKEKNNKYPLTYLGKPLSGRKEKCPVCNEENIPVEFATTHYNEKHSDI